MRDRRRTGPPGHSVWTAAGSMVRPGRRPRVDGSHWAHCAADITPLLAVAISVGRQARHSEPHTRQRKSIHRVPLTPEGRWTARTSALRPTVDVLPTPAAQCGRRQQTAQDSSVGVRRPDGYWGGGRPHVLVDRVPAAARARQLMSCCGLPRTTGVPSCTAGRILHGRQTRRQCETAGGRRRRPKVQVVAA